MSICVVGVQRVGHVGGEVEGARAEGGGGGVGGGGGRAEAGPAGRGTKRKIALDMVRVYVKCALQLLIKRYG